MRLSVHLAPILLICLWGTAAAEAPRVGFKTKSGELEITVDDQPIASYMFRDPTGKTPRPYFAHLKAPGGAQVSRNHPPVPGHDATDHDTMHPGLWLAFGDLDGTDFWRNRATIVHAGFVEAPHGDLGRGAFVEDKQYLRADKSVICTERFRCEVHVRDRGFLLIWDSAFHSNKPFYFGDQEEMGLGLRVATPLSEVRGGQLSDAAGRHGAQAIWSEASRWCDYSGVVDGQRIGMTLMCHPENFRPSWMHARNYGFVAANPFGRQAMKKGPASKVVVTPGETLRLRYAVWLHAEAADADPQLAESYADYLKLAGEER